MGKVAVTYNKKIDLHKSFTEIYSRYDEIVWRIDFIQREPGNFDSETEESLKSIKADSRIIADYYLQRSKTEDRTISLGGDYSPLPKMIDNLQKIGGSIYAQLTELHPGETYELAEEVKYLSIISTTIKDSKERREGGSLFDNEEVDLYSLTEKTDYLLITKSQVQAIQELSKTFAEEIREALKERGGDADPDAVEILQRDLDAFEAIMPYCDTLQEELSLDLSLEEIKSRKDFIDKVVAQVIEKSYLGVGEVAEEITPEGGTIRVEQKYSAQDRSKWKTGKPQIVAYCPPEPRGSVISELANIAKSKKLAQIQVSKDIWNSQIESVGDTLAYVQNEKMKEKILKLQKQGKLLAGTTEGLSGGSAQLKVFTIALARTLNEQSKYYKTEEDWSGVPKDLIPEIMGQPVEIEKKESVKINGEDRQYPYILVSYSDMAKKMSKTGKISGGKDTETIREYIEELSRKEYLLANEQSILGIPFIVKEATIYSPETGTELGCILRLSPQFSRTCKGYTGLRADTIQLLGGGKQKDLTMDLLELLLYKRGIPNDYRISKKDLLDRYSNKPTYRTTSGSLRRSKLEGDIKEAIEKIKTAKVITNYREEKNPGGEVISVFVFSRGEYLEGLEEKE